MCIVTWIAHYFVLLGLCLYTIATTKVYQKYIIEISYFEIVVVFLWGTCKVRNEIQTKRNETERNETKSNKTKRNETDPNETKRNVTKRNEM